MDHPTGSGKRDSPRPGDQRHGKSPNSRRTQVNGGFNQSSYGSREEEERVV